MKPRFIYSGLILRHFVLLCIITIWLAPASAFGQTLLQAAQQGDTATASQLIAAGADVNQADSSGNTPLMIASGQGNLAMTNLLLTNSAKVNLAAADGSTALIDAAKNGFIDLVNLLLASGADPTVHDSHVMRAYDYAVEGNAVTLQSQAPAGTHVDLSAVYQALRAVQ